jgi:hypothetical protein
MVLMRSEPFDENKIDGGPSDVKLLAEHNGGEQGGELGAEGRGHGGVERAPHRDAPRLQVEIHP